MKPVPARVLQAVTDKLETCSLEDVANGGTVSIVVKLDGSGYPRRIAVRSESESEVERRRPLRDVV